MRATMQLKHYHEFPHDLAPQWDALLKASTVDVPFLRFDCMQTWWQTCGGGEWSEGDLTIITAEDDSGLIGIAPLFHAQHQDRNALMFLGSIEVFDYLDFIARPENLPAFVGEALDYAAQIDSSWHVMQLYNIVDHSPTLPILQSAAAERGWKYESKQLQPSPYIPMPGDWDTYLASIKKKQRHEIRRKIRRLEEAEVPSRWYIVKDENKLESEMDSFLDLMAQDPTKVSFLTDAMHDYMQRIARCSFRSGFLQLSFLEIDGEKAAGKMLFNYRNRLWAYNSGVDQRFREYSPGWVLLGYLLQWANENEIEEFDFMRGDETYKYRFGAIDRFVMQASLTRN